MNECIDSVKQRPDPLAALTYEYANRKIGRSRVVLADCLEWLARVPEKSLHAIVTDPPYGVKEYESEQLQKKENGHGGIWRIPPSFDGSRRSPVPRFTALNANERCLLMVYFRRWSELVARALRPGGHVFIASNAFLSNIVFSAVSEGGLEFRGELIRLVQTLRGGNRPKNAEEEFPGVCSTLRGAYEPWGVFRRPLPSGMTVSECLLEYETGGLRRGVNGAHQFTDVIVSERTSRREREIAAHPSLKPQSLLRQLVYMALPLGAGIIADPFMGAGSTVAAAEVMGQACIGIERHEPYYQMALDAVPKLAALPTKSFSFYDSGANGDL